SARATAGRRQAARLPDSDDRRSERRGGMARCLRRGGTRRGDREAGGWHLSARQARDVQDQARTNGRLRGGGVPLAQERKRQDWLAAPRTVRRGREASSRGRHFVVHDGRAEGARVGARTVAAGCLEGASLARMGGCWQRRKAR